MCLVLSWKIRLELIWRATWLSHTSVIWVTSPNCNSLSNCLSQPSFLQNIHGILSLRYNNTIIGLCHLNTQEIFEFAKIFGLKMVTGMFQLRDVMVLTPCKNDVINKYYQVNTSSTRVSIKYKMIYFTPSHTKLLNKIAKLSKPGSRRLF